jgi:thiol-disulfide isomerase/thioredoxin
MFKKLFFILGIIFIFSPIQNVFAEDSGKILNDKKVNVYFFWGKGCPHCEEEKKFLNKMEDKYPQLRVHQFEVWGSSKNRNLMLEFGKKLNVNVRGVPFTVIGEHHIIGWLDEKNTGKQLEEAIICSLGDSCRDVGAELLGLAPENKNEDVENEEKSSPIPDTMTLPFIGEIKTKNLSLPIFTVLLGALDGFNPCAMWALLFLISLLIGMENKKRMWIFGSTFIVASAFVYFLFMAAWLNLLLFIGFIFWIRVIIGLVALGGGAYNLKEYFSNPAGVCKVTGAEKRQKFFEKLKNIVYRKNFYIALGGIIILAFAVNLVELICSAGLPVVFTQVLALSDLSVWQYYFYMLLYILIFMLDDLIVFFLAMATLQVTGITSKYSRISHLVGGILMLIIGLLLIFKPELLMF